jgi:type III pantothenate kinase
MSPAADVLIDAGNTTVKAAVLRGGELGPVQVWPHAESPQFAAWLESLNAAPRRAWLVNVAQPEIAQAIIQTLEQKKVPLTHWQNTPLPTGFENLYVAPTLGPDRLLAAIGARHARDEQVLVVASFGTATTVDLVVGHSFHGGLILPGVRMMAASLNRDTAQLPLTQGTFAQVPRSTHDAIFTGICAAQRGAVDHMLQAAQAFGIARLVVSGGAALALGAHLPTHSLLPHAVLRGLAVIAHGTAP